MRPRNKVEEASDSVASAVAHCRRVMLVTPWTVVAGARHMLVQHVLKFLQ